MRWRRTKVTQGGGWRKPTARLSLRMKRGWVGQREEHMQHSKCAEQLGEE